MGVYDLEEEVGDARKIELFIHAKAQAIKLKIYKIAITGPESTGKSTLARQLAIYYETVWVPEYAREYIDRLGRPYHEEDLVEMARGHSEREKEAMEKASRFLFTDTELTNLKIWSEHKYGRCAPEILDMLEKQNYDLYLLCAPDLPWAEDAQRENPEKGEHFFEGFVHELEKREGNVQIVRGEGTIRLKNAVAIIDSAFSR